MDACVGAMRRPSVAQTAGSETRAERVRRPSVAQTTGSETGAERVNLRGGDAETFGRADGGVGDPRRTGADDGVGDRRRTGAFHGTLALPFTGRRKLALTYGRRTSGGAGRADLALGR